MRSPPPITPPDASIGALVLRIARGERATLDVAAARLHEAERHIGIGLSHVSTAAPGDESVPPAVAAAFLDATALVIDGVALQTLFWIADRSGREVLFSHREWGHHVAEWANRTQPLAGGSRPASPCPCEVCRATPAGGYLYVDFAWSLDRVLDDPLAWTQAWVDVVRRKIELFGAPFAS